MSARPRIGPVQKRAKKQVANLRTQLRPMFQVNRPAELGMSRVQKKAGKVGLSGNLQRPPRQECQHRSGRSSRLRSKLASTPRLKPVQLRQLREACGKTRRLMRG